MPQGLTRLGFWESREHAREGGKGPWHRKAREAAGELYESIVFETYSLVIEDDVKSWRFEKYDDRDARPNGGEARTQT